MGLFRRAEMPTDGSTVPHPHTPGDDTRSVQVEPLNPAELVWAAQHREIITGLCSGTVDTQTLGDLFDRVQAIWLQSDERDRTDPEPLVHAFGVTLGDLVAQRVPGLVWGSARGDGSPELVLTHAEHDLVVFPVAAVGQSWGSAPVGWVAEYVTEASEGALAILARDRQPH